ncbi:MAG: ABC transporter permease [Aquabacterium sp.]
MSLRRWLTQVSALMTKEWKQLYRDRALLSFVIFIFTLDILLASGAPALDLKQTPIGIIDRDHSALSRELIYKLPAQQFTVVPMADQDQAVSHALERGELRGVLTIPHGFEKDLLRAQSPALQLVVDASDANLGFLLSSYTERILFTLSGELVGGQAAAQGRAVVLPQIDIQSRTRFNPSLTESWYATLSELLTMVTVACILLPAAALVREKERGTVEQLLVSPLSPLQIVLAKAFAMTSVVLLGSLVAVGLVMHQLVGVPFVGSPWVFFSLIALYAITSSGLGVLASTFARNSGQVGLIVVLLVMPIIMLSGTWSLRESMPAWLQNMVAFSPMTYFVDIAYGVLLKGSDMAVLWPKALKMSLLGLAFWALGVYRFQRQFR